MELQNQLLSIEQTQPWGFHTSISSLHAYFTLYPNKPAQIFLRGRLDYSPKVVDTSTIVAINRFVAQGKSIFVHAPYNINLANPSPKNNPKNTSWGISILKHTLQGSAAAGCKGVVVHVGKARTNDLNKEYANMAMFLKMGISYATKECPLLLETSAGQGNDLCVQLDKLLWMHQQLNSEEKEKFGICVDTCHVFSAGYEPEEFLMFWINNLPGVVKLIHFNDSETAKWSKVDRHAAFGAARGTIGREKLLRVAYIAQAYKIPLIAEWAPEEDEEPTDER